MLDRREHARRRSRPFRDPPPTELALETAHARRRHQLTEMWILSRTFHDAPPPRIARDVDHRREGPVDAVRARFHGGDARGVAHAGGVEARRFGERHGKDGAPAVDDVLREEQRDVQPRLLDGDALHLASRRRSPEVEKGADASIAYLLVSPAGCARPGLIPLGRGHGELPHLLVERHAREQRIDESLGAARPRRLGGCGHRREGDQQRDGGDAHRTRHDETVGHRQASTGEVAPTYPRRSPAPAPTAPSRRQCARPRATITRAT